MNSALGQNDRYLHYILAIWEGPLHVTAKLTEMVQYIASDHSFHLPYISLAYSLSRMISGGHQDLTVILLVVYILYLLWHHNDLFLYLPHLLLQ